MALERFRRMTTACDVSAVCLYINSIYSVSLQPGTLSLINDEFIYISLHSSQPFGSNAGPCSQGVNRTRILLPLRSLDALFHVIQFRQLQHGCEFDFHLLQVRS